MARRRKSGRNIHGILLLDKRQGVSSNRVLQEVRRLFDANKAGHTGSLDPLATGLLPVCFGEATKVSSYLLDTDKRYRADVKLGVTTDSGDAEAVIPEKKPVPDFDDQEIEACLNRFVGEIDQVPPMYSALKHEGQRLYKLAREGRIVERKPRRITIFELSLLSCKNDVMTIDVNCSKGTYIRTLAEDIGLSLGCGGTITALRRLEVGKLTIDNAWTLEKLQDIDNDARLLECLIPVDHVLSSWPAINLKEDQKCFIRQGQQVELPDTKVRGIVRMYSDKAFLGIGEILSNGKLAPKRLFNVIH